MMADLLSLEEKPPFVSTPHPLFPAHNLPPHLQLVAQQSHVTVHRPQEQRLGRVTRLRRLLSCRENTGSGRVGASGIGRRGPRPLFQGLGDEQGVCAAGLQGQPNRKPLKCTMELLSVFTAMATSSSTCPVSLPVILLGSRCSSEGGRGWGGWACSQSLVGPEPPKEPPPPTPPPPTPAPP